jgi:serine/threonine-protein kinase RsbW
VTGVMQDGGAEGRMNGRGVGRKLDRERRFATCTRAAKQMLDDVVRHLNELSWGEDDVFAVHLALEEALMNAIKHGNCLDSAKQVHVVLDVTEEGVRFQITDEGAGFDPASVPDPTLDENLELPSGRGLMLMRTFMSRVEFNERGNQVTMEKHRVPRSTESA